MSEPSSTSPDDLLTTADVAELAGRSTATVSRWAQEGRLPVAAQARGRVFYRRDVDAFLTRLREADALVRKARRLTAAVAS